MRSLSHHGDLLYDVVALKDELLKRWMAVCGRLCEAFHRVCVLKWHVLSVRNITGKHRCR